MKYHYIIVLAAVISFLAGSIMPAAPRPFVLSGVLEEVTSAAYQVGKGVTITSADPSIQGHLRSLAGHRVVITVVEGRDASR